MSDSLLDPSAEEQRPRLSDRSPRRRRSGDAETGTPPWLRAALAKRDLRPRAGWPPVHHLLTERDLPSEEEEDEKVPVSTAHDEFSRGLCTGLVARYRQRPDVFVAHDLFVYFDGGGRAEAARLAPDLLVSFGAPKRLRGSYAVWEEGKPPDFVLEILSESTWRKDVEVKPGLYERMGVREYFVFDPHGHIDPLLRAWRFADGRRERLPVVDVADGMRGVHSETLKPAPVPHGAVATAPRGPSAGRPAALARSSDPAMVGDGGRHGAPGGRGGARAARARNPCGGT